MPQDFMISTSDQLKLFAQKYPVESPKANVIIVHGLGEHSGRYSEVCSALNGAGFNVYVYDHRGHGKSEGIRAYVNDYNDYLNDLKLMVGYAKSDSPSVKNFILGHSMGGFITALFGIKTDNEVDGIILSGAATQSSKQASGAMRAMIRLMGKISPKFSLGNDLGKIVSKDQNVVNAYIADPLNAKKITMGLYNQFLIKGIDFVKAHLNEFHYPVLILHGEQDLIIDNHSSQIFHNTISSTDKSLKIYPGLYHEIMNEPEKQTVVNDIISWLKLHS